MSVAFSPDGKTLASGSRDKTVRLWELTLVNDYLKKGPDALSFKKIYQYSFELLKTRLEGIQLIPNPYTSSLFLKDISKPWYDKLRPLDKNPVEWMLSIEDQ